MTLKLKLPLAFCVAVAATALILVRFATYSIRARAADEVQQIRAEKMAQVEQELADKVNTVYALVDSQFREATEERYLAQRYGPQLRSVVDLAFASLQAQVQKERQGALSRGQAQREALAMLRAMRFGSGKGYLWVSDLGRPYPRMMMHPLLPQLEGSVLDAARFDTAGDDQRNLFQVAVEACERGGEGFVRYRWPEPSPEGLLPDMPKFSYVRLFKEWGWVVGTGVYVDEAVREKLAETIDDIRKIRYGSEYFWISTSERPSARMVMHPIRPELDGQPLDVPEFELEVNGSRRHLFAAFRDLTEKDGQGFAQYRWPRPTPEGRPGAPALKLSFVRRYAPLGWVIGTGKHIDDIEEAIARTTRAAEADVSSLIRRFTLASLAMGLLAMLAAGLLAVSLTRPLGRLVRLARELAYDEKHLSRRLNLHARDEIGQLGAELDYMAARIERSFANVREQRELLQSVLSNLPHSIYWKDRNLVYLGCNAQFARTVGLPAAEEIVGKTDAQLGWASEERALLQERDRIVLETGQPAPTQREALTDGAGRRVSFLVSRVPLRDQGGNLMGLLGVLVELDEGMGPTARS